MRVAFYAPMKPPDHPVPSGDREIARAVMAALEYGGAEVDLASQLRTRDGAGDVQTQHDLSIAAAEEAAKLIPQGQAAGWQVWVTYHNYYKAPDLIGPAVAAALGIPYVQIESTRARKRLTGPWAAFAQAAETATDAAQAVFYFSHRDAFALELDAPSGQKLHHLRPFLNAVDLPNQSDLTGSILSVGMMRRGDKLASYQIIADTLAQLHHVDWTLEIVGDGPARAEVAQLMAPYGTRVRFAGQMDGPALQAAYARSGAFFWPGVNEALGMVYLEAQAAGLAVVAQDRPGMRDVLAPSEHPNPDDGTAPLAQRLADLLNDPVKRKQEGGAARQHVLRNHLLPQAAETLMSGLRSFGAAT